MKTILEQLDEAEKALNSVSPGENSEAEYYALKDLVDDNIRALIDIAKAAQAHCSRVLEEQVLVSDSECEIIDALEKLTSPCSENLAP